MDCLVLTFSGLLALLSHFCHTSICPRPRPRPRPRPHICVNLASLTSGVGAPPTPPPNGLQVVGGGGGRAGGRGQGREVEGMGRGAADGEGALRGGGAGGVLLPSLRSTRRCRAPAGAEARLKGEPVASRSQAGAAVRRARVCQGQGDEGRVSRTRV